VLDEQRGLYRLDGELATAIVPMASLPSPAPSTPIQFPVTDLVALGPGLFALTAIPGLATVLLLLFLKERRADLKVGSTYDAVNADGCGANGRDADGRGAGGRDADGRGAGGRGADGRDTDSRSADLQVGPLALPSALKRYLFVLSIFTLGNSADAFLLLRLTEAAGGPRLIPVFWSLLHIVKMGASLVGGAASDKVGRRPLIAMGWLIYAVVYAGFAFSTTTWALVSWFLVYGMYYGCVEGTERALVADFARATERGTAFGVYNAVAGIGSLVSSVVFGLIWQTFGSSAAFASGAVLALVAAVLLFVLVPAATDNSSI
jgi:hypothetical protein